MTILIVVFESVHSRVMPFIGLAAGLDAGISLGSKLSNVDSSGTTVGTVAFGFFVALLHTPAVIRVSNFTGV